MAPRVCRKWGTRLHGLLCFTKCDEEGGSKTTMTTTMTTITTETASLLPPPGWNTIKFIIGNAGDDNVESWAFLRAGLFLCIAVRGGVDGGAMMTTKGGRGRWGLSSHVSECVKDGYFCFCHLVYRAYEPSSSSYSLAYLRFCCR
jgi:hypothetical protein